MSEALALETDYGVEAMENKFLTFKIDQEEYGIEIEYVTQILGMMKITKLPEMPEFIQGVINLRGKVIPVIDVRLRFGVQKENYTERTCIIVIDIDSIFVGLIVDQVLEVIDIFDHNIEPPPSINKKIESRYIQGLGKVDETVKILISTQNLLYDEELKELELKALEDEYDSESERT